MVDAKQTLIAPPVIRRTKGGMLQLWVAGHPVDGAIAIASVCDREGSYTTVTFHNSAVIYEVEPPDQAELDS